MLYVSGRLSPVTYFYEINIIKQNMKTYCLVCRKITDNINSKMVKTKNNRLLLSQCSVCKNKKSRFISEKEQKDQEF